MGAIPVAMGRAVVRVVALSVMLRGLNRTYQIEHLHVNRLSTCSIGNASLNFDRKCNDHMMRDSFTDKCMFNSKYNDLFVHVVFRLNASPRAISAGADRAPVAEELREHLGKTALNTRY